MEIVGHLMNRHDGLYGTRGLAYDYITAGNGLFIEAKNDLFSARVAVYNVTIRGLKPMEPYLFLRNKVDWYNLNAVFQLATNNWRCGNEDKQYYCILKERNHWETYRPEQTTGENQVRFIR